MTSSTAAIHVAKKQLGLDDDTYRAKLQLITGKPSTKSMTEAEKEKVLTVFRKEGFRPEPGRRADGRPKLTGKYAGKLQALWIAGYNLGIFRNRDDAALTAFIKRQTGLEQVQWLRSSAHARQAVEALKGWIAREGGVDWSDGTFMPDHARTDGFKIAWAQWLKLGGTVHATSVHDFHEAVFAVTAVPVAMCNVKDWQSVMNHLGQRIRDRKKEACNA